MNSVNGQKLRDSMPHRVQDDRTVDFGTKCNFEFLLGAALGAIKINVRELSIDHVYRLAIATSDFQSYLKCFFSSLPPLSSRFCFMAYYFLPAALLDCFNFLIYSLDTSRSC